MWKEQKGGPTAHNSHSEDTLPLLQLTWAREALRQVLQGMSQSDRERPLTSPGLYAKAIHSHRIPIGAHFLWLVSSLLATGLCWNCLAQTLPPRVHFWAGSEPGLGQGQDSDTAVPAAAHRSLHGVTGSNGVQGRVGTKGAQESMSAR